MTSTYRPAASGNAVGRRADAGGTAAVEGTGLRVLWVSASVLGVTALTTHR